MMLYQYVLLNDGRYQQATDNRKNNNYKLQQTHMRA